MLDLCSPAVIREELNSRGFRFSHRHGQNFLTAAWVPERIAGLVNSDACVLEIGPGFGALTAALAGKVRRVVSLEIDTRLIPMLRENLCELDNIDIVETDALKADFDALLPGDIPVMACANLPYSLTTPLLTRLLEYDRFGEIVVMVQREFADRLLASPSEPEYGAFTLFCSMHAVCERMFNVPPDCFLPRPKVYSSVIKLTQHKEPPVKPEHMDKVSRVVRAAFGQRRKTLINALSAGLGTPKERLFEHITAVGIPPETRGETLSLTDFYRLTLEIYR